MTFNPQKMCEYCCHIKVFPKDYYSPNNHVQHALINIAFFAASVLAVKFSHPPHTETLRKGETMVISHTLKVHTENNEPLKKK